MESQYKRRKEALLTNKKVCKANRDLFKRFLEWEEDKLLKINDLQQHDDACYKTLLAYLQKLTNVNKWFDKPLKDISQSDFKKVYDGLERGTILTQKGKPFRDKRGYYHKIFCSKLFRMIGKSEMAREIIEEHGVIKKKKQQPKYIREEEFRRLADAANLPKHKLLMWLCFDYGENINTMLQLKKSDFERRLKDGRIEYNLIYRQNILKRARTKICDVNNYDETAKFLDQHLGQLQEDDNLFDFTYHSAVKFLKRAAKYSKVKVRPYGGNLTWNVLRKSMFTDLASKGWTGLQIKKRAGHKPSSSEIDIYLNLAGVDTDKENGKGKVDVSQLEVLRDDLQRSKHREKILNTELLDLKRRLERMEAIFENKAFQKIATDAYISAGK